MNLVACASYEIRIFENFDIEPKITKEILTYEQFQKLKIEVQQIDPTSLKVFWSYDEHPRCSKKFQIKVFQDNVVFQSLETTKLTEIIDHLEPCETYNLTVNPMKAEEVLISFGDFANYTMNQEVPSIIRDLKLDYNEDEESIEISWLAPEFASKCIKNYSIQAESEYDNRMKYDEAMNSLIKTNIQNVFACVNYAIKISANMHDKKGAEIIKEILVPSRSKTTKFCINKHRNYLST